MGTRSALRRSRRRRRAPAGPPWPSGHEPRVALLAGPAGAEALILQTIEETRAAGGTGLALAHGRRPSRRLHGTRPLRSTASRRQKTATSWPSRIGTDPDPKLPDLPGPHDVSPRSSGDRDELRLANGVEAGVFPASTWGEADTRAYLPGSRNSTSAGRGARTRTGVACTLRYLARVRSRARRRTGDRGYRGRGGGPARRSGCGGAGTLPGHRRPGRLPRPRGWRDAATPSPSAPRWPSPRPTPPHPPPSSEKPASTPSPGRQRTPLRPRDLHPGQHIKVAPGRHPYHYKPVLVLYVRWEKLSRFGLDSTSCAGRLAIEDMSCVGTHTAKFFA
jgi:hypothetical protein